MCRFLPNIDPNDVLAAPQTSGSSSQVRDFDLGKAYAFSVNDFFETEFGSAFLFPNFKQISLKKAFCNWLFSHYQISFGLSLFLCHQSYSTSPMVPIYFLIWS